MKPKKPAAAKRSVWPRILGYGGATALVVAAVVVLLVPMLGKNGNSSGLSANQAASGPQATSRSGQGRPSAPGDAAPSGQSANPLPQQNPGTQPYPGGQGDPVPGPGAGAGPGSACPPGLGAAQRIPGGLRVVVQVAGTAIAQVEVHLRGLDKLTKNGKISGGKPKVFDFKGAPADRIERIQIKTFGTMVPQACDLRSR